MNIIVLSLSGLLQLFVGASGLIKPVKTFAEKTGIALGDDVNLLSEARGIGGLMMLGGLTMLLGAALPQLRLASLVVATVIFAGFALASVSKFVIPGPPHFLRRMARSSAHMARSSRVSDPAFEVSRASVPL